jgi:hypothetical protein
MLMSFFLSTQSGIWDGRNFHSMGEKQKIILLQELDYLLVPLFCRDSADSRAMWCLSRRQSNCFESRQEKFRAGSSRDEWLDCKYFSIRRTPANWRNPSSYSFGCTAAAAEKKEHCCYWETQQGMMWKKKKTCERFGSFGNVEVTPIWTNSTGRADRSRTDPTGNRTEQPQKKRWYENWTSKQDKRERIEARSSAYGRHTIKRRRKKKESEKEEPRCDEPSYTPGTHTHTHTNVIKI